MRSYLRFYYLPMQTVKEIHAWREFLTSNKMLINTEVWYLLPFKDYREVVLATFYSDGESIFKDVTDNYKKTYPHIKKVELQAICAIEELEPDK